MQVKANQVFFMFVEKTLSVVFNIHLDAKRGADETNLAFLVCEFR
jgi:hypothetical protein